MTILLCLLLILAGGVYLVRKSCDFEIIGIIVNTLTIMYLIVHLISWSLASYDYNLFVTKREAFVQTLEQCRKEHDNIELAAISKNIAQWNEDLAERKYNLKVFILKDYVDERTENLKPIK